MAPLACLLALVLLVLLVVPIFAPLRLRVPGAEVALFTDWGQRPFTPLIPQSNIAVSPGLPGFYYDHEWTILLDLYRKGDEIRFYHIAWGTSWW